MLEIIDNIGYMKLMDGTSLLAHKKSTEQKIEDNWTCLQQRRIGNVLQERLLSMETQG